MNYLFSNVKVFLQGGAALVVFIFNRKLKLSNGKLQLHQSHCDLYDWRSAGLGFFTSEPQLAPAALQWAFTWASN